MRRRWTSAYLYRPFALGLRNGSRPTPDLPGHHGNVGGSCNRVYCIITAHSYRSGPGYSGPVVSSRNTSGHSHTRCSCRNSGALQGVHAICFRWTPYCRGRRHAFSGYQCTTKQYPEAQGKTTPQCARACGTPRAGRRPTTATPTSGAATRRPATYPTSTTCPPKAGAGPTTPATRPATASAMAVARTARPIAVWPGSTAP